MVSAFGTQFGPRMGLSRHDDGAAADHAPARPDKTGANHAMALATTLDARAEWGVDQVLFAADGRMSETGASDVLLLVHVVRPMPRVRPAAPPSDAGRPAGRGPPGGHLSRIWVDSRTKARSVQHDAVPLAALPYQAAGRTEEGSA